MYIILIFLTGAVLVFGAVSAYMKHQDGLHPLCLTAPFFLYGYFYIPFMFQRAGNMGIYFSDARLIFIQMVYLVGILSFCVGCMAVPALREKQPPVFFRRVEEHPALQRQFRKASLILWLIATAVNLYVLYRAGGFWRLYGGSKAYVSLPSGYIADLPVLVHVAVIFYALSLRGRKVRFRHFLVMAGMEIFGLMGGTIGGRRGFLFVVLGVLFFAWYVARAVRPKFKTVVAILFLTGVAVLFVQSQRRGFLRIGSGERVQQQAFRELLLPNTVNPNHFYMVGGSHIVYAHETGRYGWGQSIVQHVLIRPIPRQIWPGKYAFLSNIYSTLRGSPRDTRSLREVIGWQTARGTALGSVADAFGQFSWGFIFVFLLLGQIYGRWWRNFRWKGGVWTFLFGAIIAMTPYLVTQSLGGAYFYRLLLFAVPAYVVWRRMIEPWWENAMREELGKAEETT